MAIPRQKHRMNSKSVAKAPRSNAPSAKNGQPFRTIVDLIDDQAGRTPEAIAVSCGEQQLTYGELEAHASQLARRLRALGVQRGALVAVCIERSLDMVLALLGSLKAGAGYVPLDPAYPKGRLAYMLEDAAPPVLLTHTELSGKLPPYRATTLCLDTNWRQEISGPGYEPPTLAADDLAYMIYTSGSTGEPKGAMNTHGGILNRLLWMQETHPIAPQDRVLQKTPFSFDISVWEFFWPLMTGAKLVLAQPGGHQDSGYLVRTIQQEKITTIHFVPSMMRVFLEEAGVELCKSLKRVICSGEALSLQLKDKFFEKLDCELHNLYGPTEAAVEVTAWQCRRNDGLNIVPIGRPISNIRIHVLDEEMNPVTPEGVGELYIGGAGVARGYGRRPGLTAEKFVPDPFDGGEGQRLYRTGDLGRYLPGDILEFLGRTDSQVKVRGFRLELGEIEAVLLRHPGVKDAAVLAMKDSSGDARLAAYFVPGGSGPDKAKTGAVGDPSVTNLQDFLQEHLPAYMVPSAFVLLEKMPLSPNGKLDRKALPPPEDWVKRRARYVAPRTPREKRMAEVWESLLNVQPIGVEDNFFDLGGHSLIATQFLGQLRQELKVDVPFRTFFTSPTIAGISGHLEHARELPAEECLIRRGSREGIELPLSFSQERVWFLHRLYPGNLAYNFQSVFRFRGKLSVELLERGLTEIIRRHEIFRTTFHESRGHPVQLVHDPYTVTLPVIDLRQSTDPEKEAQAIIDVELQKSFDLQRLPLIYWVLIRISNDEHLLFHKEHHLVHDGWSFNYFLHELFELYRAWHRGTTARLDELPIQFADFALWQREWMQTEEAMRQLEYWKKKLSGAPELLALPWDHPRPAAPSYKGGLIRIELPLKLCQALRARSREDNVTLYMTMFTAFAVLMQRFSGQAEICLGSGIANRRRKETHTLIGMIVNNAVMRCNLSGNPEVRALLQQVRETALEAYENQDIPFDRVVEAVHPKRSLSCHPLYQIMFSFHDSPLHNLTLPECDVAATEAIGSNSAKLDININIIPRAEQSVGDRGNKNEGITLLWEYSSDLFDAATMEHWLAAYQNLLAAVASDSGQRIDDLPLFSAQELKALASAEQEPATRQEGTIHAAFEEITTASPSATAVVYRERSLTYQELNCQANQVAHHLRSLGIGPGMRVGICVERSLEMVVGILGVLKAGGAYVPMDPAHPMERLAYVMEDAEISVLLTQLRLRKVLPRSSTHVVCLDDIQSTGSEARGNPDATVCAEDVAYVIYTSGSTGMPKGVEVTHGNVLRLFIETERWFNFGPQDVWALFHSYAFDFSVWELWGALLYGGRVVVVPRWVARSAEEFYDLLISEKVTVLNQTPSAFQQLIRTDESRSAGEATPELALRLVIFGGEALDFQALRLWTKRHPDRPRLVNMYGITETTVHVTWHPVTQADFEEPAVGSRIGIPIADLKVYLLDRHTQPVPLGMPGELYVAGRGLARGYLKRPELTAERFVPNPFSRQPGERLYRSGDLARCRADGKLEYLGRIDNQVKIRGYRIELGEIEAALNRHEAVRESAVMLFTEGDDKRLIAYVVPHAMEFPMRQLKEYLEQRLPEYMVPQQFAVLEALPVTANGKLDRASLPAPDRAHAMLLQSYVEPETDVQRKLAQIWAEVLHVQRVGIHDNFFELGGHSLLGTQVMSRVRDTYDINLPLRSIFEQGTVAQLAEILQAALRNKVASLPEEEARRLLEPSQVSHKGA